MSLISNSFLASMEDAERVTALTLSLPALSEDDPLCAKKKRLFSARNLKYTFHIPLPSVSESVLRVLDEMVLAARILHLVEVELYFVQDDHLGPFSIRNELESLNTILLLVRSLCFADEDERSAVLKALEDATRDMIKSIDAWNIDNMVIQKPGTDSEEQLLKWGEFHGLRTKLGIAHFKGAGRGAVALDDLSVGDIALDVPESLIISEDLVYESDMLDALKGLGDITAETMLLLWSMRERYNCDSKFKTYFDTLPDEFNTGLRFGIDALAALEGTLLFEELLQVKQHLRQQYDALCPALCMNYPDVFQPRWYSWEQFLWACELWYSNGMKVVFSDGKLRTCLVPIAGILNHSLTPHILRYGRIDSTTKSLRFPLSRPCKGGDQCYLSYGNFPGSHFVTFYGFLPKGDNPFDTIPLDFDAPVAGDGSSPSSTDEIGWATHMVRGTWLSKSSVTCTYGLPRLLLAYLRSVLRDDDIELPPEISGQDNRKEKERAMLDTILSIFTPMMEGLGNSDDLDRETSNWDVKLALDYKDTQRRIISSILDSCTAGLRMLEDL